MPLSINYAKLIRNKPLAKNCKLYKQIIAILITLKISWWKLGKTIILIVQNLLNLMVIGRLKAMSNFIGIGSLFHLTPINIIFEK